MMTNKPVINVLPDKTKVWGNSFNNFSVKVLIPETELIKDIVNFGFEAPYLLVFDDKDRNDIDALEYAKETGLLKVASEYATSVVFVKPSSGSWKTQKAGLFEEIISNSKIHQYHKDGYVELNNRFTHTIEGYAIRGAIFRTFVFANGEAADYVAENLLKTVNGDGLWGPADVTVTSVLLEGLSVIPKFERKDIPVVSLNNSKEALEAIKNGTESFFELDCKDFYKAVKSFMINNKRWVGKLETEPDFDRLGMVEEYSYATVKTSKDNSGDDKGSDKHDIGYIAFYNKDLFKNGPAPLLLCFHGGGDSAMYISHVSEWWRVAKDHNFLLVCIENHLNSTASEMIELLSELKKKYNIDSTKVYGSGFSMGGCKSWDLYQEYPEVFAGLAPMDATFEVGLNVFGENAPKEINNSVLVPIFYVGGEITPLPELPFQAQKCVDRVKYVFDINKVVKKYDVKLEDKDTWENKIWGICGDEAEKIYDPSRDSYLNLEKFVSEDGNVYTVLGSVSDQGHECRHHSCDNAWKFLSKFSRVEGKIVID